jgi:hypothetical protein
MRKLVFLTVLLCIGFSNIAIADSCETCTGYVDWQGQMYNYFFCNDRMAACQEGGENCAPCIFWRTLGSCTESTGGTCDESFYETHIAFPYTYEGPSAAVQAACYLAWLVHQNDFIRCTCEGLGAECIPNDCVIYDWQFGCVN